VPDARSVLVSVERVEKAPFWNVDTMPLRSIQRPSTAGPRASEGAIDVCWEGPGATHEDTAIAAQSKAALVLKFMSLFSCDSMKP
jgi:hypothetical protein